MVCEGGWCWLGTLPPAQWGAGGTLASAPLQRQACHSADIQIQNCTFNSSWVPRHDCPWAAAGAHTYACPEHRTPHICTHVHNMNTRCTHPYTVLPRELHTVQFQSGRGLHCWCWSDESPAPRQGLQDWFPTAKEREADSKKSGTMQGWSRRKTTSVAS